MRFPGQDGGETNTAGNQEKGQELEESFAPEMAEHPSPQEQEDGREDVHRDAHGQERVAGGARVDFWIHGL